MRKIAWALLALLLLIIICVSSKVDKIHLAKRGNETAAHHAALTVTDHTQVAFDIYQKGNKHYTMHSLLQNGAQGEKLRQSFVKSGATLNIERSHTDETLEGKEAITLTTRVIPLFVEHFENGHISYHHGLFLIEGVADSYDTKRKLQSLLANSTVQSRDLSTIKPPKPNAFTVRKTGSGVMDIVGIFDSKKSVTPLLDQGIAYARKDIRYAKDRNENGATAAAGTLLKHLNRAFTKGELGCKAGKLYLHGYVKDEAALQAVQKAIAALKVPVEAKLMLDPELLRKRKEAQEAAKRAAEEAKRKALEAQQKAEEEARRKAEIAKEKEEAKRTITSLLQVENIEFETAKSILTPRGVATVDKLAEILKRYPDIRVEIGGYTDSDGDDMLNLKLSQERVDSVKKELISRGINGNRINAKGFGESNPIAPNDTEENKQRNRRVEIKIIGE